jgi:hypothetical protein
MYRGKVGSAALACASTLMTVCTAVPALQFDGDVGVDARYTDNAGLVSTNETDDLITTARVNATLEELEGPLTGSAVASLRYLDYLDNTFGNQTYFSLGSTASLEQLEKRLVWTVSDYYNQTSIDNLAANTPDNTQDVNAFSLSAAVTLPVAARHLITVTPSFQDFQYDISGNDNQQLGVAAGWAYQVNPTTILSLNGAFRDVDFDDVTANPDFESTTLDIGLAVTRARTRYAASIGATRAERDVGAKTDGVTGRLTLEHDFTARSTIIAYLSSAITDSGSIFLSSSINPNTGAFSNVQVSNDIVRDSVFRITYNRQGSLVNSRLWTELRDLDYDTAMLDREVQEVGADITYPLTALLTGSVSGIYLRTKDTANMSTDKEYQLSGRLDYSLSRKLTANIGVRVQSKDSSVATREYDEQSIIAGIAYRLGR